MKRKNNGDGIEHVMMLSRNESSDDLTEANNKFAESFIFGLLAGGLIDLILHKHR